MFGLNYCKAVAPIFLEDFTFDETFSLEVLLKVPTTDIRRKQKPLELKIETHLIIEQAYPRLAVPRTIEIPLPRGSNELLSNLLINIREINLMVEIVQFFTFFSLVKNQKLLTGPISPLCI